LFGKTLDAINIVIPAIGFGDWSLEFGVCDSIHLMFHFRDAQLHGLNPIEAIAESVREIGGACSLTAISTGIGFLGDRQEASQACW